MRITLPRAVAVLAVLCTPGCAPDPKNFVTYDEPVAIRRLAVRAGGGNVLWDIQTAGVPARISEINYGALPPGFVQLSPTGHAPRPLVPGEPLSIFTAVPSGIGCHYGVAEGADGFLRGAWTNIPFDHPKNPAADRAFAEVLECLPLVPSSGTSPDHAPPR
jgi:hypothetical protein